MKFSFVTIVLNGQPFLECALKSVYRFAHQVIVIEGAVEKCMFAANPDGGSKDGTVEALRNFPDPEGKLKVVRGRWPEKAEMQDEALKHVTGDYVWLMDSDEVYKEEDLRRIEKLLEAEPDITQVDFIPDNFWKGFDTLFISPKFFERANHYRRLFKFRPGCRFTSHRPPTLLYPDLGKTSEQLKVVDGWKTRMLGIFPYHYSYVFESQVAQKIELYNRYGWGDGWGVDLNAWYREGFLRWTPQNRRQIEKKYPAWTGDPLSFTTPFTGRHPEAVVALLDQARLEALAQDRREAEERDRLLLGSPENQRAVVEAWSSIELDKPLTRRRERFAQNADTGMPFWNLHVALAVLARDLKPKSYLEIGVRTGGSMSQVLWHAPLKRAVGVDLWEGSYAGFKNEKDFTRLQMERCLQASGKKTEVKLIQGDSHKVMKDLIKQGLKFDLINVDGDHSEVGNLEDLEDAVVLLSERGAIVFDDLTHAQCPYLLPQLRAFEIRHPYFRYYYNTRDGHGTVVLTKNFRIEDLARAETAGHKPKIARNEHPGQDKTQVDKASDFAHAIAEVFADLRPQRLVETGTYLGQGTTRVVAQTLKALGLDDAVFYSLEVNPRHLEQARNNLSASGLLDRVRLLHGLSVPRATLPTLEKIRKDCVENPPDADIFVDHEEADRALKYYQETDFAGLEDDLLGRVFREFGDAPDFVLLDSAGHMGFSEFRYAIDRLRAPCVIALDDVYHIKHHRSFQFIRNDARFQVLRSSREKFGFCIARFTPVPTPRAESTTPPETVSERPARILWFRTDSIGDGILASAMLPGLRSLHPDAHVAVVCWDRTAQLYEYSPFVDEVIAFDKDRARGDAAYRNGVLEKIRAVRADLALNSIYSREPILDLLATQCGAAERVAMEGDLSNMDAATRESFNRGYTRLIPSPGALKHELERHKDFLAGLGLPNTELEPAIWRVPEFDYDMGRLLRAEGFVSDKTLVLFAGAQADWRVHKGIGKALAPVCRERGLGVVAVGTAPEFELNQGQLNDLEGVRTLNLCGKLNLLQTAALLSHSRLAVGAETGTAHMACAVETPNVVIVGGGHFGRFMPWSPLTVAVSLPLECFGCNWHCKYSRAHCVQDIPVASITRAVIAALDAKGEHPRIVAAQSADWKAVPGAPSWRMQEVAGAVYG